MARHSKAISATSAALTVPSAAGIHRRGDDRLAVEVAAGPVIAAQQVGDPGEVLSDLALPPGVGGRGYRFR